MKAHDSRVTRLKEVAFSFGWLGISSFGGPSAHIGYFRDEFVARRRWLDDAEYARLVALCQLLPGPASSQVGMALGFRRAGYPGMFLAWLMFSAPSAILLAALAMGAKTHALHAVLTGLMAAAVGVVAHAVWSMARGLGATRFSVSVLLASAIISLFWAHPLAQVVILLAAAAAGIAFASAPPPARAAGSLKTVVSRPAAYVAATALVCGVVGSWFILTFHHGAPWWLGRGADYFYVGSLVFGGGHVVLPMLLPLVVGEGGMSAEAFLSGYAAAQAVPGPLFTLVSYLGAVEHGWWGAVYATVVMFAPAALMVIVGLYLWDRLEANLAFRRAQAGINAAVVGLLAAAWCDPILTHGVLQSSSPIAAAAVAAVAGLGVGMLRRPPWQVIAACAGLGVLLF